MKQIPLESAWKGAVVGDVMRSDVVTIDLHAPVRDALRLLAEHGISGMPVTDGGGGIVGVISMRDVLGHLAERVDDERDSDAGAEFVGGDEDQQDEEDEGEVEAELGWHESFPGDGDAEVSSVMTPELVTIEVNATVELAARTMIERRVHRLVVRDGRRFVGLVTATDVLARIVGG